MANCQVSMKSLCASFGWITPIPTDCGSIQTQDKINDNDHIDTQVDHVAHNHWDLDNDDHNEESTFPKVEDSHGQDEILSEINDNNQKEMLEQNIILLKLQFEQQAECNDDRPGVRAELHHKFSIMRLRSLGNQSNNFMMEYPIQYCGRATELDTFVEHCGTTLHQISTNPEEAIPIKPSTQTPAWTHGITTDTRHSNWQKIELNSVRLRPKSGEEPMIRECQTISEWASIYTWKTHKMPQLSDEGDAEVVSSIDKINRSESTPTVGKHICGDPVGV